MANVLQLKRGTEAQVAVTTPAQGEPVWLTDTKRLRVGDGSTVGGVDVSGGGVTGSVVEVTAGFGAAILTAEHVGKLIRVNASAVSLPLPGNGVSAGAVIAIQNSYGTAGVQVSRQTLSVAGNGAPIQSGPHTVYTSAVYMLMPTLRWMRMDPHVLIRPVEADGTLSAQSGTTPQIESIAVGRVIEQVRQARATAGAGTCKFTLTAGGTLLGVNGDILQGTDDSGIFTDRDATFRWISPAVGVRNASSVPSHDSGGNAITVASEPTAEAVSTNYSNATGYGGEVIETDGVDDGILAPTSFSQGGEGGLTSAGNGLIAGLAVVFGVNATQPNSGSIAGFDQTGSGAFWLSLIDYESPNPTVQLNYRYGAATTVRTISPDFAIIKGNANRYAVVAWFEFVNGGVDTYGRINLAIANQSGSTATATLALPNDGSMPLNASQPFNFTSARSAFGCKNVNAAGSLTVGDPTNVGIYAATSFGLAPQKGVELTLTEATRLARILAK